MKRKIIFVIAIILILLTNLMPVLAKDILTWNTSEAILDLNNSSLKKAKSNQQQAWKNYYNAVERSKSIDTQGMSFEFNGVKSFYTFDLITQMMLTKQKELMPEQMKYYWELADNNGKVTRNTMVSGLRGVFLSLAEAESNLQVSHDKLKLAQNLFDQNKLKFNIGLLTQLDFDEADYSYQKAQMSYNASKRSYENSSRNFNNYVCISPEKVYDEITFYEKPILFDTKNEEYYVAKAIDQRLEIVSLKKQLLLKQQELKIQEYKSLNIIDLNIAEEYSTIQRDIEVLNLELSSAQQRIDKEIRDAYTDMKNSKKSIDNLGSSLQLQSKSLKTAKMKYDKGLITETIYKQYEINYKEFENSYNAAVFSYNTKNMNFSNACAVGPAYQKGGF